MGKTLYTENYIKNAVNKIDGYKLVSIVEKQGIKYLKLTHNLCGKTYDSRVDKFLGKDTQRCTCLRKRDNALVADIEDYNKTINSEYKAISQYKGRKKPITIKHNCGFEYEIKRAEFLLEKSNAGKCPVCTQQTHNTTEIINEKMKRQGYSTTLAEVYKGTSKKHLIKNNSCGHTYEVFLDPVINRLKGKHLSCPVCEKHSKQIDIVRVQKEISEKAPTIELISTVYNGTHNHLQVKCKKCNNLYNVSRTNILSGKGCPFCTSVDSKLEKEMKSFIKSIYAGETFSNKKFNYNDKTYELDIYIPELKLGVEFNGLYWHSDVFREKNYHLDKTNFFSEQDIRVIHVFEDEWVQKRSIVESKLRHALKVSDRDKVYGRHLTIKEIDKDQKNIFLKQNHIQGTDHSSIMLGAFKDEELVSVMTFSKPRVSLGNKNTKVGQYELSRFASSKNVIGSFAKLMKYALNKFNIESIITYADLRWSNIESNIYEKNGFVLSHVSNPNYFYCSSKVRYHRFNFRKQVLKAKFPELYDEKLTEFQIMDKTNYTRIWDCGNAVYTYKKE
jgi:hypothetical protein